MSDDGVMGVTALAWVCACAASGIAHKAVIARIKLRFMSFPPICYS
jgi:hypothetical protein